MIVVTFVTPPEKFQLFIASWFEGMNVDLFEFYFFDRLKRCPNWNNKIIGRSVPIIISSILPNSRIESLFSLANIFNQVCSSID